MVLGCPLAATQQQLKLRTRLLADLVQHEASVAYGSGKRV